MLSLGGVEHLTGGSKKEGCITCDALLRLCNCEPVEMGNGDDPVTTVVVQAGDAPIINGEKEKHMRVGCGSAAIGMFAEPGTGWGGTDNEDPLTLLGPFNAKIARPGLTLLMVSTTGEQHQYFVLDDDLVPQQAEIPARLKASADLIAENCEPSICSVLFMGCAGGCLRAGVTENPVRLTRLVKTALTYVSCGGAEAYVWPGGGITVMIDVTEMPPGLFGYVPTPALVAPIVFTMRHDDYGVLGGYLHEIKTVDSIDIDKALKVSLPEHQPDPMDQRHYRSAKGSL